MQKIFRILMLMLVTALAACGGGGDSPGGNPNQPNLVTTAGDAVVLPVGATNQYQISGGVPPYRVTYQDQAIATAAVDGTTLRISGVAAGVTSVSVMDYSGFSTAIAVQVGAGAPQSLFSTAPTQLNIINGTSRTYQVTGGTTPYSVTSADLTVADASISGSSLVITARGPGQTTITVSDRDPVRPATLTIGVTVGSSTSFFVNAPATVQIKIGTSQSYLLNGGTTPYSVFNSTPTVATASIAGTTLTVHALKAGTATLELRDAAGSSAAMEVVTTTEDGTSGSGSTTPVNKAPVLQSAGLVDASGASTNSISASGYTTLAVTLASPTGQVIPNQLITVSGDPTQVGFPEGASGLTDASGVARIKIKRAALTATGAGSLTVTYSYKAGTLSSYYPNTSVQPPTADTVVSTYVGYQLATANITLDNLDVGTASLAAYGTRQVSVQVNLNGAPTPTPVQVNFTTTCGQISPATASTNSEGKVTVSYSATDATGTAQSTQGCSGKTVEISASTLGAAVTSKTLNVLGAPATNMAFVSATPTRIYLANSGGPTQSLLKFKLVNAQGEPILGRDVVLSLKTVTGTLDANKATFGSVGNISAITTPTDSNGEVSVPVFSGTVPTNVLVNAKLAADTAIQTDSAVLTIASGRPAQARVSLSIEKFAIEGFNVDGDESTVTMSLADRQGNPVPDGTAVNFVTEGGVMIPPVCTTGTNGQGNSQCMVKIRSQNPRPQTATPRAGRVSILAYAAGEEDFNDRNFNNVHDAGETFTDLGTAFRDDNENNVFDNSAEFSVPRTGASPTSGDGVWGAADVRGEHIIIFATSGAVISTTSVTTGGVAFVVADGNGNSMPTGSQITVTAVDNTENDMGCAVAAGATAVIPNTLDSFPWAASLSKCATGDMVVIEVKTPKTNTVTGLNVPLR
ncbi:MULTISPECIES: beta strand repeat-containing protein [Giesbergeria]|uniref:Beta strand repeat-containing protein n=1 Tax=Giesbergeria sinuosa TaxID=80883 RepID=A0ABV9Q9L1_9BURK